MCEIFQELTKASTATIVRVRVLAPYGRIFTSTFLEVGFLLVFKIACLFYGISAFPKFPLWFRYIVSHNKWIKFQFLPTFWAITQQSWIFPCFFWQFKTG